MLFDRLLKFLWKFIFDIFTVKNIKYNFNLLEKELFIYRTPFVCLSYTYVLETVNYKLWKQTYHLITNDNDVLSCILTNKCYFRTWMDDYQPKSSTKFDDFRDNHVQLNKICNWTYNSQKQYIVWPVNKYPYPLSIARFIESEISLYTRLSVSSFMPNL